jgi:hypothetical protein
MQLFIIFYIINNYIFCQKEREYFSCVGYRPMTSLMFTLHKHVRSIINVVSHLYTAVTMKRNKTTKELSRKNIS